MLNHGWEYMWWGWCSHMHASKGINSEFECWDGCTSIRSLYLCHMRIAQGGYEYVWRDDCTSIRTIVPVPHACTCHDETVVRPGFEEELPPLFPPPGCSQKLPSSSSSHPPIIKNVLSFIFPEFSFPICWCVAHISLQHNCNHNLPWNCVQSSLKCFTTLNCFLFLHNMDHIIAALFLLNQVEHSHTLTFQTTSPFCCCYMSFQHKCKLYTCWLWLILYFIKQFWLISQSVSQLVGEIVILLAWRYLLVDWLILYWLTFSLILWWAIDELMNQSCTENFLACQLIIAVQFFCYHRNNW